MANQQPIEVSAVSYLNALPMVYGLEQSPWSSLFQLRKELPAHSAEALAAGRVQLALMPVGALHTVAGGEVVGNYCVGATGPVHTVCLIADEPVERLRTIYLDPASRTSVQLIRILAEHHWGVNPDWQPLDGALLRGDALPQGAGMVLIGDKVFAHRSRHQFVYDLAVEWIAFSGLPFVFAAWVAPKGSIAEAHLAQLNAALEWGVARPEQAIANYREKLPCSADEAVRYLSENIDYPLTARKKEGMAYYLELRERLKPLNF